MSRKGAKRVHSTAVLSPARVRVTLRLHRLSDRQITPRGTIDGQSNGTAQIMHMEVLSAISSLSEEVRVLRQEVTVLQRASAVGAAQRSTPPPRAGASRS